MSRPEDATHYFNTSVHETLYYQYSDSRWWLWYEELGVWKHSSNRKEWFEEHLIPINPIEVGSSVLDTQHGGEHYKGEALQPWEIINANGLDFYEGNCLKYLLRHKSKNGAEDIDKAIHYLQAIKEFQYGK